MTTSETMAELIAVDKLKRDVRATAASLGRDEIKGLVDLYYRSQEHRIALGNQSIALAKADKPTELLDHFHGQLNTIERQVISALEAWSDSDHAAAWAKSQVGIGPVLASALLAHIDITRAPTAGAIWRFFGLDPTVKWGKGEKRPWNADAKVLAWKIGDSFVKVSGREDAFYGKKYRERKAYELARDESGGNAETAAKTLEERKIVDPPTRKIYESGHLPPGRLDLRARRWAVKLFLAHLHEVMYREHYGTEPPLPYPIAHLGHTHHIAAPPGK
jgi:hypothetical protein